MQTEELQILGAEGYRTGFCSSLFFPEPGVAEIMDALGKERSVVCLRGREIVS